MLIFSQCAIKEDAPEKPKMPKKRKRRSCIVALISFLLSLILLGALALAIPVTLLRFILTDHNIEVMVDHIVDTVDISGIVVNTDSGNKKISEVVLDYTSEIEALSFLTEEQIRELLSNDFAKGFLADALKQYGLSLKAGEGSLGWTPEQIYSIFEANKDTIERLAKEAGYEGENLVEENREVIVSTLESAIGEEGLSPEAFLGDSDESVKLKNFLDRAQLIFSDSTLWLVWGLVGFIALLLLFLNISFLGCFCRACGFPAFIVGGLYSLSAFAVEPVLAMVTIENAIISELLNFIAGFSAALLADISIPTVAIGLCMIVISFIFDIIQKSS